MYPKVFIGITTYNHENYIVECLDSIAGQTYHNLRVVISDDYSKDNTVNVIEEYLRKKPSFPGTLIKHAANLGISKNVNFLISQITDEDFVSLFSGDDIMQPTRLEKQVAALQSDSEASFCYSDMEWFLSTTGKKIVNHFGLLNRPTAKLEELLVENSIPSPTLMYRNAIMKGVRYDESLKFINDHMFIIELLTRGKGIFINEALVRYRKHSTGASVVQTYYEDRVRLLEILKVRFSKQYPKIIQKYEKFINYSSCLELQKQGRKKEAVNQFIKTFPTSLSSFKWLGRTANMTLGFFRN